MKKLLSIIIIFIMSVATGNAFSQNAPLDSIFADFLYSASPSPNTMVVFTDTSWSTSPIISWQWNFGDPASGINNVSGIQNPVHYYSSCGQYTVSLKVVNSSGNADSISKVVFACSDPCNANYAFTIDSVNTNIVHFTDLSTGNLTAWFWTFGDGGTSNLQNPDHLFIGPGSYNVCLQVWSDSSCTDTYCDQVTISGSCQAVFTETADSAASNHIYFTDLSTGSIQNWYWIFGDGTFSSLQNPDHYYNAPGLYDVCLYISSNDSLCASSTCHTIVVDAQLPCQSLWYYINTGNNTISFTDQSTGKISGWYWTFGDEYSSTEQNPIHQYNAPGFYPVCLTITGDSCTATHCDTIMVGTNVNCESYFEYQVNNLTASFMGNMVSGAPAQYFWSFGDGSTESGQNPSHTYAQPGSYEVTMNSITLMPDSCSYSTTQTISVGDTSTFNQIFGQVFAGSFPVTEGLVIIYSTGNSFPFVDVDIIDSSGIYYFAYVPAGQYYIWAVPFVSGYLPTYYGDVLYWEDATVVSTGQLNNPYNINLITASGIPSGNGSINGHINGLKASGYTDKIRMLIRNEAGTVIGFSNVDESGSCGFSDISYGTYYLEPELPGCTSDVVAVTISPEHPVAEVIMTYSNGSILGVKETSDMVSSSVVYPNPASDIINTRIVMKTAVNADVTLNDLTGRQLFISKQTLDKGENNLKIPVADLAPGSYILNISSDKGSLVKSIVVRK